MAHLIIVGAFPHSLINFRGDLIKAFIKAGHRVTAMSAPATNEQIEQIKALGAEFYPFLIKRNNLNPLDDLKTLISLYKAFKKLAPDAVIAYTIKPVIWSGWALKFLPKIHFHALITGLGYSFQPVNWSRKLLQNLVSMLYKHSLHRAKSVIFQNPDNLELFVSLNITKKNKCYSVNGSGVNLDYFSFSEISIKQTRFLLIARLLIEKGLYEFVEAARLIKQKYPQVELQILGSIDSSPDAISLKTIKKWEEEGNVEYLGETKDVRPFLRECSIFVLPSYHEGMPRSVLEAMAIGRPILTTDIAGSRETVKNNENGFLVPPMDSKALANKMEWFILNKDKWQMMGNASRKIAKKKFDVQTINKKMLQIIDL